MNKLGHIVLICLFSFTLLISCGHTRSGDKVTPPSSPSSTSSQKILTKLSDIQYSNAKYTNRRVYSKDGYLYVCSLNNIYQVDPEGTIEKIVSIDESTFLRSLQGYDNHLFFNSSNLIHNPNPTAETTQRHFWHYNISTQQLEKIDLPYVVSFQTVNDNLYTNQMLEDMSSIDQIFSLPSMAVKNENEWPFYENYLYGSRVINYDEGIVVSEYQSEDSDYESPLNIGVGFIEGDGHRDITVSIPQKSTVESDWLATDKGIYFHRNGIFFFNAYNSDKPIELGRPANSDIYTIKSYDENWLYITCEKSNCIRMNLETHEFQELPFSMSNDELSVIDTADGWVYCFDLTKLTSYRFQADEPNNVEVFPN